jgi:hypothetical protein
MRAAISRAVVSLRFLPQEPGIGFELNPGIMRAFSTDFA